MATDRVSTLSDVDLLSIKDFATWLRLTMYQRELTQRELGRRSGVDHATISRLLSGEREPLLSTAQKLFRVLR